jgi:hypothetical protein
MIDARSIARALGGDLTGRNRVLAPGPGHSPRDRSLSIKLDPHSKDGFVCHSFAGQNWRECRDHVRALLGLDDRQTWRKPVARPQQVTEVDDTAERIENAIKIWSAAGPLYGSLGWYYFTASRGLDIGRPGLDHCLRFHTGFGAIIALMTDAVTGRPAGVHRTFLNDDGTKLDRKMLGKAGVIRLTPDENATLGLGIVEGIETGLRILLDGWSPIWTATSASGVASFPVLGGIECLTVFADNDDAGTKAATKCAERWNAASREVRIASTGDAF